MCLPECFPMFPKSVWKWSTIFACFAALISLSLLWVLGCLNQGWIGDRSGEDKKKVWMNGMNDDLNMWKWIVENSAGCSMKYVNMEWMKWSWSLNMRLRSDLWLFAQENSCILYSLYYDLRHVETYWSKDDGCWTALYDFMWLTHCIHCE